MNFTMGDQSRSSKSVTEYLIEFRSLEHSFPYNFILSSMGSLAIFRAKTLTLLLRHCQQSHRGRFCKRRKMYSLSSSTWGINYLVLNTFVHIEGFCHRNSKICTCIRCNPCDRSHRFFRQLLDTLGNFANRVSFSYRPYFCLGHLRKFGLGDVRAHNIF